MLKGETNWNKRDFIGQKTKAISFIKYFFNRVYKSLNVVFLVLFLCFQNGCNSCREPRLRLGAYFGAPLGIAYPDPNNLGKHNYVDFWGEKIGLVYTSRGGFIDIGHLRDAADRTEYCTSIVYENLSKENTEFTFTLLEPSEYKVTIKYSGIWNDLTDKDKLAKDISIEMGQYFAYTAMVWHEIITWYGYKYTGIFSEYISSFSWEDIYSDLIGVRIAGKALHKNHEQFDETMTKLIYDELQYLDVQPVKTAKRAEKMIKGKWYRGTIYPLTELAKRNLDIGIDDGYVTPWLVPGVCNDTLPVPYSVPDLSFLEQYGITIEFKIEPKIMEKDKILKAVYPENNSKYIFPAKDFSKIMDDIRNKEIERYGKEFDLPEL